MHSPIESAPVRAFGPSNKSTAERAIAMHAGGTKWSDVARKMGVSKAALVAYLVESGHKFGYSR